MKKFGVSALAGNRASKRGGKSGVNAKLRTLENLVSRVLNF